MKKFVREFRIIPMLLIAASCLAVLKIAGLVLNGGYIFSADAPPRPQSWAETNLNFPTGRPIIHTPEVTGSVEAGAKKGANGTELPEGVSTKAPTEVPAASDPSSMVSPSEQAVLERLQARRQELEARAREIEIRESLVKSAEQKLEGRLAEIKATEARITAADQQKTEAESARLKGLVTMYENMKPKDAARVFDRLDIGVLYDIAIQIAPRKMSDIMGQMQSESAERLTVEIARRAGSDKSASLSDLPKIEGRTPPVSGP